MILFFFFVYVFVHYLSIVNDGNISGFKMSTKPRLRRSQSVNKVQELNEEIDKQRSKPHGKT